VQPAQRIAPGVPPPPRLVQYRQTCPCRSLHRAAIQNAAALAAPHAESVVLRWRRGKFGQSPFEHCVAASINAFWRAIGSGGKTTVQSPDSSGDIKVIVTQNIGLVYD
jgi:hypothetical protein